MCLFIFTKAQLLTIRGIGTQFINHNIFPRLDFDTLQIGRSKGGLGILDPVKQQNALQWRWVRPLLVSDQSPVTPHALSLVSLYFDTRFIGITPLLSFHHISSH